MTFDMEKARMKGVVLLDCWQFDKVVSSYYGIEYSSVDGTRDSEVPNGSLVTADAALGRDVIADAIEYADGNPMDDWLEFKTDYHSPHPAIIIADLVSKGEAEDLHYQIYVWW